MRAIVAAISLSLAASAVAQSLSDPNLIRTDYLTGFSALVALAVIRRRRRG